MSQSRKSAFEAPPATEPTPVAAPVAIDGADGVVEASIHRFQDAQFFRRRFWLCLVLTAGVFASGFGAPRLFGPADAGAAGIHYLPALLGLAVVLLGGRVFVGGAAAELRARRPGAMALACLAITIGLAYGLAVTFGMPGRQFWAQLAGLVTVLLLARWVEIALVGPSLAVHRELAGLLPEEAAAVVDGDVIPVPTSRLVPGDQVFISATARVPADGEVVAGEAQVDESAITGVGGGAVKGPGEWVRAGSAVLSGTATVRVARVGDQTGLAMAAKAGADVRSSVSATQANVEQFSGVIFLLSLGVSACVAVTWLLLSPGDPAFAVEGALAVLVVASPVALRLAIPLAVWASTAVGVRGGVLVRNRRALDDAWLARVVLFDKTGTLTHEAPAVTDIVTNGEIGEEELLGLAAAVERKSGHPTGRAIVAEATARGLRRGRPSKFAQLSSRGAKATIDHRDIVVASVRVAIERGMIIDAPLVRAAHDAAADGKTVVYVLTDREALGVIALADPVRAEADTAVCALRSHGIRAAILTGDSREAARCVGAQLGIAEVFAEVLPEEKAQVVRQLQHHRTVVAVVGDPINDAAALGQADVSMAVDHGGDAGLEAADIVLSRNDPRLAVHAVELSGVVHRAARQNLRWVCGYHVIALALAAGVAVAGGVVVPPALAAALPIAAVAFVVLNSRGLKHAMVTERGATRP